YRLLLGLFSGAALCLFGVSTLPALALVVPLLFLTMGMLGMGNGAIFQIAPQRFPAEIELTTGIVGAAGGLGGFFLPSALGALKDFSGSYGVGVLCFAILISASIAVLLEFGVQWSGNWTPRALQQTRVFSYRARRKAPAHDSALAYEADSAAD
ncbi:MAG: hypothetical protein WAN28_22640, partial [Terracidiphilus sp.]